MKTITFNTGNVSAYTFADDVTLTASADNITTPSFIIGDMNSSNATIHTGVTAPDGWQGGKHTFDGSAWGNVAGWVDPVTAQIAALQAQIDALGGQMWSSPVELYPVHITPLPPAGMAYVVEPQVARNKEYMIVQPISKPYEVNAYSTLHWVA